MSSGVYSGAKATFEFVNRPRFYACSGCGEAGDSGWTVPVIEREHSATLVEWPDYSTSGGVVRQFLGCANGCARPLDRLLDAEAAYAFGSLLAVVALVESRGLKWAYKNGRIGEQRVWTR